MLPAINVGGCQIPSLTMNTYLCTFSESDFCKKIFPASFLQKKGMLRHTMSIARLFIFSFCSFARMQTELLAVCMAVFIAQFPKLEGLEDSLCSKYNPDREKSAGRNSCCATRLLWTIDASWILRYGGRPNQFPPGFIVFGFVSWMIPIFMAGACRLSKESRKVFQ